MLGGAKIGGFGGRGPGTPREVHSVHWYPPGGGGGPKKRHLVLYKLAGFSPADREACRPFFSLHSSPLTFHFLSKKCKKCPKMAIFGPKNPIFRILGPLFSRFFAFFRPGRGDPFFRGDPPRGGSRGSGQSPPSRGPGGRTGGCEKSPLIFPENSPMNFLTTQLLWGTKYVLHDD